MNHNTAERPWYREPYVWLVISLPVSAILAGIVTVYLAVKSNDGLVVDDYYKRGLEVNRILERDRKSIEYRLHANINISGNTLTVRLKGNDEFSPPDSIHVNLLHPTRKNMDLKVELPKTGDNIYSGLIPDLPEGRWYVLIESQDWRLLLNHRQA